MRKSGKKATQSARCVWRARHDGEAKSPFFVCRDARAAGGSGGSFHNIFGVLKVRILALGALAFGTGAPGRFGGESVLGARDRAASPDNGKKHINTHISSHSIVIV